MLIQNFEWKIRWLFVCYTIKILEASKQSALHWHWIYFCELWSLCVLVIEALIRNQVVTVSSVGTKPWPTLLASTCDVIHSDAGGWVPSRGAEARLGWNNSYTALNHSQPVRGVNKTFPHYQTAAERTTQRTSNKMEFKLVHHNDNNISTRFFLRWLIAFLHLYIHCWLSVCIFIECEVFRKCGIYCVSVEVCWPGVYV